MSDPADGGRDFLLPHEVMHGAGVPRRLRAEVGYQVLAAKYCALVEAAMKATGGEPRVIDFDRLKEINAQHWRTTPPEVMVMVAERPIGGSDVAVSLATVDEVRAANRRFALAAMGGSRN